jgi:hypothetical protein
MAQDQYGTVREAFLGPLALGLFLVLLVALTAVLAQVGRALHGFYLDGASLPGACTRALAWVLVGGPLRAARPVAMWVAQAVSAQVEDLATMRRDQRIQRVSQDPAATVGDRLAARRPATVRPVPVRQAA